MFVPKILKVVTPGLKPEDKSVNIKSWRIKLGNKKLTIVSLSHKHRNKKVIVESQNHKYETKGVDLDSICIMLVRLLLSSGDWLLVSIK